LDGVDAFVEFVGDGLQPATMTELKEGHKCAVGARAFAGRAGKNSQVRVYNAECRMLVIAKFGLRIAK
jgi:hypothetical protein